MERYVRLSGKKPAKDHTYDKSTTSEDDMNCHRDRIRERSIVQERNEVEKHNLNEVRSERNPARFQSGPILSPYDMSAEALSRYDYKLTKCD